MVIIKISLKDYYDIAQKVFKAKTLVVFFVSSILLISNCSA
jgi:hypothetical protein